eukprot:6357319-Pyramimonas_sp.AAC.1
MVRDVTSSMSSSRRHVLLSNSLIFGGLGATTNELFWENKETSEEDGMGLPLSSHCPAPESTARTAPPPGSLSPPYKTVLQQAPDDPNSTSRRSASAKAALPPLSDLPGPRYKYSEATHAGHRADCWGRQVGRET